VRKSHRTCCHTLHHLSLDARSGRQGDTTPSVRGVSGLPARTGLPSAPSSTDFIFSQNRSKSERPPPSPNISPASFQGRIPGNTTVPPARTLSCSRRPLRRDAPAPRASKRPAKPPFLDWGCGVVDELEAENVPVSSEWSGKR
jgi:hypothetical protein